MAKYKGVRAGSVGARQIKANRTAIQRKSKAKADFMKAKDTARGLSGIANLGGAVAKLGVTLAPNIEEWKQYEKGREEVGLERTDENLSLWDKLGRAFKAPDADTGATKWSMAEGELDVFGEERGVSYSSGELKRIGMESMAGTLKQTLGGRDLTDMFGTQAGKRLADPLSYQSNPSNMPSNQTSTSTYTDTDPGARMYTDETGASVTDWSAVTQEYKYDSSLDDLDMIEDVDTRTDDAYFNSLSGMDEIQRKANIEIGEQNQASMLSSARSNYSNSRPQESEEILSDPGASYYDDFDSSSIPERTEMLGNAMIGGRRGVTQQDIDRAMQEARQNASSGIFAEPPPLVQKDYESMPIKDKVGSYLLGQKNYQNMNNKIYDVRKDTGVNIEGQDLYEDAPSLFSDAKNAWDNLGRAITGSNSVMAPWSFNKKMPWSK